LIGRKPFQLTRYGYLVDQKGFLLIKKVPSTGSKSFWSKRQCASGSLIGRVSFQSTRYILINWKETLLVNDSTRGPVDQNFQST
jgi:hypothetical protein